MAITNFIPTVWSESLYQELDKKYVGVANCNRDFEGEIHEKGNTVRICGVGNVVKNRGIFEMTCKDLKILSVANEQVAHILNTVNTVVCTDL